ncbi:MAG TPA: S1/P1 nuclease [Vicinamibacterales bacterium]|nr:S1/P1 nuclease [Vicinamibacterales bacterium]
MTGRTVRVAVFVAVQLLACRFACAWGHEGHRVIAKIAAKTLSTTARQKVAAILGTTDAGVDDALADAATWPDEIDKKATATEAWHFINVPITKPFATKGLCPNHNCVIDQITAMRTRLANNAVGFALPVAPVPPRPMTSQELAFLVHFVGDAHQPLHAATDGDRGGNCVPLATPLTHGDGSTTTELHAVWDTDEVLAVLSALGGENAAAATLVQRAATTHVTQSTPRTWAKEAFTLAKSAVYQKLQLPNRTAPDDACAAGITAVTITSAYIDANVAAVERQLLRAGIRLSNVLNQICAGNGCQSNP